jgi:hypothetical protein
MIYFQAKNTNFLFNNHDKEVIQALNFKSKSIGNSLFKCNISSFSSYMFEK